MDEKILSLRMERQCLIQKAEKDEYLNLYRRPLPNPTPAQTEILTLIENAGPFNIQQLKEETGLLVKQITPVLHRLQEGNLRKPNDLQVVFMMNSLRIILRLCVP